MTCEQLAELIQEGSNDELMPLLWDKTRLLIFKKCKTVWRFYSGKLERFGYSFEDLQQESYNALVLAVKQYRSAKGYAFTTYLTLALKKVLRGLLKSGSDALNTSGILSLDQPISEDKDGGELLLGDTIGDESAATSFEEIEGRGQFAPLHAAVNSLSPDLRDVIREHYFEGLQYNQIGERHGYGKQLARQLCNKALRELRKNKRLYELYGEEYGFFHTCGHKSLAAFLTSRTSEVEDAAFYSLMIADRGKRNGE